MKKLTITFTNDEMAGLVKGLKLSGLRTKSEFIRSLIGEYLRNAK
jgi:hypothetical protein